MSSIDDNTSDLAEQQIDRQRRAMAGGGGASVEIRDGRVSKAIAWVLITIGGLLVTVLGFCANNLWQLNLTMRDVLNDNKTTVATLSDHELRIRSAERSINTLEGRNLRGGPEVLRGH